MEPRTKTKRVPIVALTSLAGAILCLSQTAEALQITGIEADFAPTKGIVFLQDNSTLPITVRLKRDGNEPESGEVQVRVASTGNFPAIDVTQTVHLKAGDAETLAHFSVRVPPLSNKRSVAPPQKLRVQVTDADGKISLTENESDLIVREAPHTFRLLVLSSDPRKMSQRRLWKETTIQTPSPNAPKGDPGVTTRVTSSSITPESLPEQVGGYDTVNAIVFYADANPKGVSLGQWSALRHYIQGGGIFIIPGQEQLGKISDLLASAATHDEKPRSVQPVDDFLYANPAQKSIVLGRKSVLRRYGMGGILFYETDPCDVSSRSVFTDRMYPLGEANRLLHKSTFSPIKQLHDQSLNNYANSLEDALAGDSAGKTPPFGAIAGFVFLYIGLLVPANYLILKRLDKRELAWLTVPLLAVQFSGGAYLLGRTLKTSPMTAHRISVLETYANSKNDFAGYGQFSIYSDRRAQLQISTRGLTLTPVSDNYTEVINPPRFSSDQTNGTGGQISDFSIKQWEAKRFETTLPDLPYMGEGVMAKMTWDDGHCTVTLTNKTRYKLRNGFIVLGELTVPVSELAPEQTQKVSFNWSGVVSPSQSPMLPLPPGVDALTKNTKGCLQRDLISSCLTNDPSNRSYSSNDSLADSTTTPKPFAYVAWFDRSPFEVKVDGKLIPGESANLLYVHLDDVNPLHPTQIQSSSREKN